MTELKADAELHKDLQPFVGKSVLGAGKSLHHPLVIQPLLEGPLIDHTNKLYLQKLEQLAQAINTKKYDQYIWLHERPYRIEAFMRIEKNLKDPEYWRLLGQVYIDSENIHEFKDEWIKLLSSRRMGSQAIMRPEDFSIYTALGNTIKIYRGFRHISFKKGISWTLSKEKAQWFASRFGGTGKVTSKVVRKFDILGYLDGRGEQEILLRPHRVYKL